MFQLRARSAGVHVKQHADAAGQRVWHGDLDGAQERHVEPA
jgi:hypothetical protein